MKLALAILAIATTAEARPAEPRPLSPSPRLTAVTVTGAGLTTGEVRSHLGRQRSKFKYCFEKQWTEDRKLAGTLKIAFEIRPNGRAGNVGILGIAGEWANCTRQVFDSVEFPRPSDGKPVAVKFELTVGP